ncbi:hypothetical protein COLO4_16403 [Corchorus olitorius]|uniref:Uncharacterized protein n=1 Tax=Corchorus olitorius TaxID=93759 RepID=A0A1R3JHN0_9ROSI|nr:hypothetical protein COLO4_16403 [Corchorus olitorius]
MEWSQLKLHKIRPYHMPLARGTTEKNVTMHLRCNFRLCTFQGIT